MIESTDSNDSFTQRIFHHVIWVAFSIGDADKANKLRCLLMGNWFQSRARACHSITRYVSPSFLNDSYFVKGGFSITASANLPRCLPALIAIHLCPCPLACNCRLCVWFFFPVVPATSTLPGFGFFSHKFQFPSLGDGAVILLLSPALTGAAW